VFRPDGQKLTGAELKQQYASLLTELDVDGSLEVTPLKDTATPYTSSQRLIGAKRTPSKEEIAEIEAENAAGAIQL